MFTADSLRTMGTLFAGGLLASIVVGVFVMPAYVIEALYIGIACAAASTLSNVISLRMQRRAAQQAPEAEQAGAFDALVRQELQAADSSEARARVANDMIERVRRAADLRQSA